MESWIVITKVKDMDQQTDRSMKYHYICRLHAVGIYAIISTNSSEGVKLTLIHINFICILSYSKLRNGHNHLKDKRPAC